MRHPSDPSSPEAANIDCPWAAISSNDSASTWAAPGALVTRSGSHALPDGVVPHDVLTTWARSCWAMVAYASSVVARPVGDWYTRMSAFGARPATVSMSRVASPLGLPDAPPATATGVTWVEIW